MLLTELMHIISLNKDTSESFILPICLLVSKRGSAKERQDLKYIKMNLKSEKILCPENLLEFRSLERVQRFFVSTYIKFKIIFKLPHNNNNDNS